MRLRVIELAERMGLDKAKLGRKADLNPQTIEKVWTTENIKRLETPTLEKLAAALGVSVRDLIAEETQPAN